MTPERAETIALQALGWLVANEELRPVFLGSTGASPDDLRERATDPSFLVAVLSFLTMDDAWIITFCDAANLGYDQPLRARYALPGQGQIEWT
jgi:hypothetical protein